MIQVSIIIPIYNTGKYLHRCIKSILSQTLTGFELILVDDGSVDESGKICDEYARQDDRIKVIHKKNEGVSIARNTGINIAQGEYIGFIDSDDWIEPDMHEKLYHLALEKQCDIVMCDAVTKYDDKSDEPDTITRLPNDILLKKQDIYPELLCEFAGSACRCIYKREIIKSNNIIFPPNIPFSEDRIFNILAMGYADKIYYTKTPFYNRYIRKGSAVNKYYNDMIDLILDTRIAIMNCIDRAWNGDGEYKKAYENQTLGLVFAAINNEFFKDAKGTLIQKYNNVKRICNKEEIRGVISILRKNDLRSWLILKKRVFLLCLIAIVLNIKHGR